MTLIDKNAMIFYEHLLSNKLNSVHRTLIVFVTHRKFLWGTLALRFGQACPVRPSRPSVRPSKAKGRRIRSAGKRKLADGAADGRMMGGRRTNDDASLSLIKQAVMRIGSIGRNSIGSILGFPRGRMLNRKGEKQRALAVIS